MARKVAREVFLGSIYDYHIKKDCEPNPTTCAFALNCIRIEGGYKRYLRCGQFESYTIVITLEFQSSYLPRGIDFFEVFGMALEQTCMYFLLEVL